jgi:hypothetical protein
MGDASTCVECTPSQRKEIVSLAKQCGRDVFMGTEDSGHDFPNLWWDFEFEELCSTPCSPSSYPMLNWVSVDEFKARLSGTWGEAAAKPLLVDGRLPIFHVVMDRQKMGLSHDEAMKQDMASEYAIVADPKANGGLIVYAKYQGEWSANPWSTRFLIRVLLENSGVSLPPFH